MLQDYYEKHNLEMKPYQYYLAEFQNVNPYKKLYPVL